MRSAAEGSIAAGAVSPHSSIGRTVAAVGLGNAIEWYDFAIYGSFAAVLGPTFFPAADPATRLLLVFAVYGTALLVRPLGAVLFGRLGDTRGRRAAMTIVIVLMGTATAAVGLLPSYLAIGLAAPVLLLLLRTVQGLAGGGEIGVSSVFMFEHAPAGRRGLIGSLQISTLSLGMAAGMAVAAAMTLIDDGAAIRSGWWRLAFVAALPLALIGWYVRTRVSDTAAYLGLGTARAHRPWRRLVTERWPKVWRGFAIIGAGSLAYNTFFIFVPNHLVLAGIAPAGAAWAVSAASLVVTAVAAAVLGGMSDRVGRPRVVAGSAAVLLLGAVPLYVLAGRSLGQLLIAQCLIGIGVGGIMSVALLAEAFPVELRATGVAMTAGLATALVGGTAPAINQLLVLTFHGVPVAPGIYLAAFAALAGFAAWRWDHTGGQFC